MLRCPRIHPVLEEIGVVVDLLSHPGFLAGLTAGLVAAAVLFGVARTTQRPAPGWGFAFAAAVVAGLWWRFGIDRLELAGELPSWALIVFPVVVVFVGAGIWMLSRSEAGPAVGPLVAIAVAGIWVTVPETDIVNVLVGATLPMALITFPPIRARAGLSGALLLAGVIAWLVIAGGEVRPWTIVASWATLFTLPVFAVVIESMALRVNLYAMTGIHAVYVVVITRVADATDSALVVTVAAVVLSGLSGLALSYAPRASELTDART